MKLTPSLSCFVMLLLHAYIPAMSQQKVKDYLHVPGPIEFSKTKYALSWTSHPTATYYKHEYLPSGQVADKYTKMIMLEAVVGEFKLQDIVTAKTAELNKRKASDAVTNYQVIENKSTGEYLLDFVISAPAANGETIVEWNAYRYQSAKDKSGKNCLILFAYSRRAYGNETTNFLKGLKNERTADINALAAYKIPQVSFSAAN